MTDNTQDELELVNSTDFYDIMDKAAEEFAYESDNKPI